MFGGVKRQLFVAGGYLFWIGVVFFALLTLSVKGCQMLSYSEIIQSVASPNGQQVATIELGDRGGATTDFRGNVSVISSNAELSGTDLLTFVGKPDDIGLKIFWLSDTELVISVSDLNNVRKINPNGRNSSKLKVSYVHSQ